MKSIQEAYEIREQRAMDAAPETTTAYQGYDCYDRLLGWYPTRAEADKAVDKGRIYGYSSRELTPAEWNEKFS